MPNNSKVPERFYLVFAYPDNPATVTSLGGLVTSDQMDRYCNREIEKGASWAAVYSNAQTRSLVIAKSARVPNAEREADAAIAAWAARCITEAGAHAPRQRKPRRTYRVNMTEYESDGEAVRRLFDCTVRATSPSSAEDLALERHRGEADQADASEIWDAAARRWLIIDNLQDSFDA